MVSVFEKNSKLKTEWSDKNVGLIPDRISYGSQKKVRVIRDTFTRNCKRSERKTFVCTEKCNRCEQ